MFSGFPGKGCHGVIDGVTSTSRLVYPIMDTFWMLSQVVCLIPYPVA